MTLFGVDFTAASYDAFTIFPAGFDPAQGMVFIPEPRASLPIGLGLLGLAVAGRRLGA